MKFSNPYLIRDHQKNHKLYQSMLERVGKYLVRLSQLESHSFLQGKEKIFLKIIVAIIQWIEIFKLYLRLIAFKILVLIKSWNMAFLS